MSLTWKIILGVGVIAIVAVALTLHFGYSKYRYLRAHADTILRDRLVASLSARFNSPVTLDSLHLDTTNGVHVTGTGLKILYLAGPTKPDKDQTDAPPIVTVSSVSCPVTPVAASPTRTTDPEAWMIVFCSRATTSVKVVSPVVPFTTA